MKHPHNQVPVVDIARRSGKFLHDARQVEVFTLHWHEQNVKGVPLTISILSQGWRRLEATAYTLLASRKRSENSKCKSLSAACAYV